MTAAERTKVQAELHRARPGGDEAAAADQQASVPSRPTEAAGPHELRSRRGLRKPAGAP